MNDLPSYLPRPGDLPLQELIKLADRAILEAGGPQHAEVHFKWTCIYCGARCSFIEPNAYFEEGECCKCGKSTPFTMGGLSLHLKV